MVKIRLMRVGKRKQPSFRVVVADSRSPRDGRIIEAIGHYHPRRDPSVVDIDNERAVYWLQQGAQPSDSVRNLLRITGAWSEYTGEAPPAREAPRPKAKATPAASVTAADSVSEGEAPAAVEAAGEAGEAAGEDDETPEARDQGGAAPDAGDTAEEAKTE